MKRSKHIHFHYHLGAGAGDDDHIRQLEQRIGIHMATLKQEILDAIAAERTQAQAERQAQQVKFQQEKDALLARLKTAEDKLASGEVLTADDMTEIRTAVEGIVVPEPATPTIPAPQGI